MKNLYKSAGLSIAIAVVLTMASCTEHSSGPGTSANNPGVEYMPDMYRSPAIEAYVDYEDNNHISARTPVQGTIPYEEGGDAIFNLPYPYPNTQEGYEAAGRELMSPLPVTKQTIQRGEEIYNIFCIQCHGPSGDGNGSITEAEGGEFPVVPSYESRKGLPEGKMFHTVTYGKGLMGSHASQLDQKERWMVVHYVKTLMSGEMPEFDESGNAQSEGSSTTANGNGESGNTATENN